MDSARKFSHRVLAAVVGAVALSVLAMACAAPSVGGGPAGPTVPTTTTTTSTTMPWSPPTGDWTGFDMTCDFSVFGNFYNFPQFASVYVDAPDEVASGSTFNITVTPGVWRPPGVVQGYTVLNVNSLVMTFPLPPNVEFVDSVMSAGSNMGTGYPSLKIIGSNMVYRVPGPFAPNTDVQMPKIRFTFRATGAPGSTVQTTLSTLSDVAKFELASVGNTCTPDVPNLVFSTTKIT